MYWINRDHRGQPMAHQLSAFYVAMGSGLEGRSLRRFSGWVVLAFVLGAMACLVTYLHWAYRVGEDLWPYQPGYWQSGASASVGMIREWTAVPKGTDWLQVSFMVGGAVITLLLAKLSATAIGTPFHPIGYALAVCFGVEYNWIVFLGVWAVKAAILRYGGLKMYLQFVPLAFGLTLGGFIAPIAWGYIGWALGAEG
jgi:hypothetical protein